jgi:hypothetical protein
MATATALLVFVPLAMLRRYQIGEVEGHYDALRRAPSQPLAVEATTASGGRVRLMPVLPAREDTQHDGQSKPRCSLRILRTGLWK